MQQEIVKKKKVVAKNTSAEWNDQFEHDHPVKAALTMCDCRSETTHPYNEDTSQSVCNHDQFNDDMSVETRSGSPKYGSEVWTEDDSQVQTTSSKNEDKDQKENNQSAITESKTSSKGEEQDDLLDLDVQVIEQFWDRLKQEDKTVFYDMFELIITKLATVQTSVKEVKNNQLLLNERITELENTMDVCTQSIDDLDAKLDDLTRGNMKTLQGVIGVEDQLKVVTKMSKKLVSQFN